MILENEHLDMHDLVAKFSDAEVAPLAESIDHKGEIPTDLRPSYLRMALWGFSYQRNMVEQEWITSPMLF